MDWETDSKGEKLIDENPDANKKKDVRCDAASQGMQDGVSRLEMVWRKYLRELALHRNCDLRT